MMARITSVIILMLASAHNLMVPLKGENTLRPLPCSSWSIDAAGYDLAHWSNARSNCSITFRFVGPAETSAASIWSLTAPVSPRSGRAYGPNSADCRECRGFAFESYQVRRFGQTKAGAGASARQCVTSPSAGQRLHQGGSNCAQ